MAVKDSLRSTLNLKHLKRSEYPKNNTIYEKAQRMMAMKWVTEDLTESEIEDIANKYPTLRSKIVIGGDIIVRSQGHSWLIRDEGRFITLYHKRLVSRQDKYHVQDVFFDLEYVFASIHSHDLYYMGKATMSNEDILELVGNNR